MSLSMFKQADYDLIRKEYDSFRELAMGRCANEQELAVVHKAFEFANEAHKNVRRRSGEPYMLHPIAVARIVVENIGLGYKSMTAALLHDVVEDTDYTVEDIKNLFGEKIASLVDGLTKIKTVLDNEDKKTGRLLSLESMQAENFKRILLTLNDDVRVVLIKLADRLHNCRTIEYMPERKRDKILSETMFIFVPLAHRLGLYEVKSEMENIWLKYKEPAAYNYLSTRINASIEDRTKSIDDFIAPISEQLTNAGFKFEIKRRIKTPYSCWHKMNTKKVEFDQIYDLYAVRIIFTPPTNSRDSERDMCYHIFSIITGIYRYNTNRVRDWVRRPKSNGYEALHCTLMSQVGVWIEVQIRSKRMDDIAEKGIAAHWAYKQDGYAGENDNEMDRWLAKVKDIIVSDDISSLELLDIIHNDLVSSEIVVFTPKGDQKTIEKGATALDFAYLIHSQIGDKAIAAKVNMKLVPLTYTLKSGDQVEIITAQNSSPKIEWLQFLTTRRARNIVVEGFRSQRDKLIADGKNTYTQALRQRGMTAANKTTQIVLEYTQLRDTDELFFRIGLGLVKPVEVLEYLFQTPKNAVIRKQKYKTQSGDMVDAVHYRLAPCCHPIPGDPIIGFRAEDGTVLVHKKSCPVAEGIASKFGDSMVVPEWVVNDHDDFPVRLSVKGIDRIGILNEISHIISTVMGVNIRKVFIGADQGLFDGYIELMVHDRAALDEIVDSLKNIEGVQNITTTDVKK